MGRCNDVIAWARQKISRHFTAFLSTESTRLVSITGVVQLKLFFALVFTLTVTACGGGGGGGGGSNSTSATPASVVVSGTVTAPNGAVAFVPRQNLFQMFAGSLFPAANASLAGTAVVPDGTQVDLVKIDDAGGVVTVVASTTTAGGNYSFDLTKLGVGYTSNLVVQVTSSSSGAKMRAFVGMGGTVDLNPVSETAVRVVMDQIAASSSTSLSNFTVQELSDITAAVNLLAMTQSLTSGFDIETTVTAIENAVAADTNIMGFIVAASAAGQASQGPGDIGNYFPFALGSTWQYQGTIQNGGQTTNYIDTVQITGAKVVNGVTTTVFHESNPNPANSDPPSDEYLVKDDRGVTDYGTSDTSDFVTPQVVPYREYTFPLGLNTSFQPINKSGVNWAQDIDGDGRPETANISATQTVSTFESVAVTAGTYPNTAKIDTTLVISVVLSGDGTIVTDTNMISEWYAPGVGLVKSTSVEQTTYQNVTDTTTTTEELTKFSPPLSFASISTGHYFTCGVTIQGVAYCWGNNTLGGLGDGVTTSSATPVKVSGGLVFTSISVGDYHVCGLTTNGLAYCWGDNVFGALGDGTNNTRTTPVPVAGGLQFKSVSASSGGYHTCGIAIDGTAYCWGDNAWGQLGHGIGPDSTTPVPVIGNLVFSMASAAFNQSCAVTMDGAVYCWGYNAYGQLGDGTTTDSATPVPVAGGLVFSTVSVGEDHSCGITSADATYCWGYNANGQLGDGTTTDSATPVPVAGGHVFSVVSAGWYHSCGVTNDGTAYCWGDNTWGALGNNEMNSTVTNIPDPTPDPVWGGIVFLGISSGTAPYGCGVATNNTGYCWGDNEFGNLGIGAQPSSAAPVPVLAPR